MKKRKKQKTYKGVCENCQKFRKIAAKSRCWRCYMYLYRTGKERPKFDDDLRWLTSPINGEKGWPIQGGK